MRLIDDSSLYQSLCSNMDGLVANVVRLYQDNVTLKKKCILAIHKTARLERQVANGRSAH